MSDKIKEEEELVIIFQVCFYSKVLLFDQKCRNSVEVIYSHPSYITGKLLKGILHMPEICKT